MPSNPLISRSSLQWLLLAQVLVVAPHLLHAPWWIVPLWLGCAVWRWQASRQRLGYPNGWAKAALMLGTAFGVWLSRGSLVGLDAGVVLLIAAFILKILEVRQRRDALVLVFLGLFSVVTVYLFDDSVLMALYSLLPVTVLLAALISLQQAPSSPWANARLAASLLLQALPLMLLVFILFPRVGPLWSLPVASQKATSGLAESMTPADIAELSRSSGLAFRVSFSGAMPARSELYWRALSFDQFDGRRWSQTPQARFTTGARWQAKGEPLNYSVIMQPSGQRWLFALDVASTDLPATQQMQDFRLQRQRPVQQALLYQARSWPQAVRELNLSAETRRLTLQLPEQGDPRSRAWALQLSRAHAQPSELVAAVLEHFNQQPYHYTLRPQVLGENSIDEFLFDTRAGFCAHYAGAMTFVLRAAGIPARVVAGYQGGEYNPQGNYLQVRQYDAHAWVEYWQAGQGWVSVDPTFAVAPERINLGLEQALGDEQNLLEQSPFSPLSYRNLGWLNQLRLGWDNLNYAWQRWVLGYQGQQQLQFLQRWLGQVDGQSLLLSLVGGAALLVGLLALCLLKPWQARGSAQQRLLRDFERLLARHGVVRQTGEGIRSYAARAVQQLPQQAPLINQFAHAYEAQRYAGQLLAAAELRRQLRQLRRSLPWRWRA
ncbi:DUF3488 and DUF4129 domain-containing transglutaminase family protein [Pseudomonas sp. 5P_3.1_Bac2]|uniref:transglutaminase TgpA family protein n=1 Tax=Pseudomonas sp. 5P_3.1_Bac2 TaxID=2971617 RepID=UPI0021C7A6D2|nr:DUF3488 and DUF4129 domain-containing transglutaminase family protein [Pseudomonas sp. 5P_3.1_Bac2]MCU1716963.1 DUF3488 and DUF4129 domain-containing transglutaminase family protein [Pseudomonas sp. 5P_3.1_Bac2]